jgi:hypothetical protein
LVRIFRIKYPSVTREQAEARILKRWMTICSTHRDAIVSLERERQILVECLDETWDSETVKESEIY